MLSRTDIEHGSLVRATLVAVFLLLGVIPTDVAGQARMQRRRASSELGLDFASSWSQAGDNPASSDRAFRQWLTIPFGGALIDPLLFSYHLSMSFRRAQESSTGLPETLKNRTFGWTADAQILQALPVSLSLSTSRVRGTTGGGLTSQGEFSASDFSGSMRYRNRYLPVSFSHSKRATENFWQAGPGLVSLFQEQTGSTTRLAASNSKLTLLWQRLDFDTGPEGGNFATSIARLDHRIGWGKGSRLETTLERQAQDLQTRSVRSAWSERMHLQHTETTASDIVFSKTSTVANGHRSESRLLSASYGSRLWPWLSTNLRGSTRSSSFLGGSEKVWSAGPQARVSVKLPLSFRFSSTGTVSVEKRSRVRTSEGVVDVVNELHRIDETRTFFINRPEVDLTTLIIRAEQEGFAFIEDVDYTLFQLGDLTQVVVLGGSRIEVGTTVFLNYQHAVPPVSEQDIFAGTYTFSLARRGISLSHRRVLREGGTTNTTTGLLGHLDETSTTARLDTRTPVGRFNLSGGRRDRATASHSYKSYDLTTSLAFPSFRQTHASVGASYRSTKAGDGDATVSSVFASMSRTGRWAQVHGRLEAMDWNLKGGSRDRSLGVDLTTDLSIGASTLSVRYFYNVRFQPSSITRNRITVRMVRRF